MHTIALTPSRVMTLASAALLAVTGAACAAAPASAGHAGVRPGHGSASRPELDPTSGDHTNAFDSTDDPSDPAFVPVASRLLPSKGDVAVTREALSTTSGTSFQLTYYDISKRPDGDSEETTLVDCDGNWLTNASQSWSDDATMQGTARFTDSSGATVTINDGGGCWVKLPYAQRWGLGVQNPATGNEFNLRPFRSIAVDPGVLTMGKWYYVKELDGASMPDPSVGMRHDGCVRAMDVGPAINGRHIDFFVGYFDAYTTLANGNTSLGGRDKVTIYDGAAKCATHISRGY